MARGELLKKLFRSYSLRDDEGFKHTADEIIRDEESKNNRVLANALRRNLNNSKQEGTQFSLGGPEKSQPRMLTVVPIEREKQLPPVEIVRPERRASDLILNRVNQHLF